MKGSRATARFLYNRIIYYLCLPCNMLISRSLVSNTIKFGCTPVAFFFFVLYPVLFWSPAGWLWFTIRGLIGLWAVGQVWGFGKSVGVTPEVDIERRREEDRLRYYCSKNFIYNYLRPASSHKRGSPTRIPRGSHPSNLSWGVLVGTRGDHGYFYVQMIGKIGEN